MFPWRLGLALAARIPTCADQLSSVAARRMLPNERMKLAGGQNKHEAAGTSGAADGEPTLAGPAAYPKWR
jgi:hypothetical protein